MNRNRFVNDLVNRMFSGLFFVLIFKSISAYSITVNILKLYDVHCKTRSFEMEYLIFFFGTILFQMNRMWSIHSSSYWMSLNFGD